MFSYRHAFHAGNHADVLKHTVLIAILKHLTAKDAALTVIDTHAGAGLYRLDGDYSSTGGEAVDGIFKLFSAIAPTGTAKSAIKEIVKDVVPPLQDYIDLVASFNRGGQLKVYPGSPFVVQSLLRDEARDKLKLFELHPTDHKALVGHIEQLKAGRQVAVERKDGFEGLKSFLPPPVSATGSRRALVLIDPSYEIKTDYGTVATCIQDCLKRFATGTYVVWYPIIPRPEAHDLPRKLKTLAIKAGRGWLHATMTVKNSKITTDTATGEVQRPGLPASGMFLINPPHTLKAALQAALPQLVERLGQDRHAGFSLDAAG
jgi:23S rRNA (adenine2030-N6)-methyltransferase